MKFPGFLGPAYASQSLAAECEECINLYPQPIESGQGKDARVMHLRPGLSTLGTLPDTPVRALWGGDSRVFGVFGEHLHEIDDTGASISDRGAVGGVNSSPCTIDTNGNQLMVVSDGKVYIDTGSSIVQPGYVDVDLNPTGDDVEAGSGCFLDGFFIIAKPNSLEFSISNAFDGTVWEALDFESKEGHADNINRVFSDHEELWLFGFETTEVWRARGIVADFPFERDPGGFMQQGLAARWSPVSIANGVAWLGGDRRGLPIAYLARGFNPQRISNHAVEEEWASYSDVSDAIGSTFYWKGHFFWKLQFPTGGATWVWDAGSGEWHKWAFWSGTAFERHRGVFSTYEFGKYLETDHTNGNLYELTDSAVADDGTAIHFRRTAPHVQQDLQRVTYDNFRLDYDGTATMTLAWSDDSGRHYTSEKSPSGPRVSRGDSSRVIAQEWRRLGESRDRIFRLSGTAATRFSIANASLNNQD